MVAEKFLMLALTPKARNLLRVVDVGQSLNVSALGTMLSVVCTNVAM